MQDFNNIQNLFKKNSLINVSFVYELRTKENSYM